MSVARFRAPLGRPLGLPLLPRWNGAAPLYLRCIFNLGHFVHRPNPLTKGIRTERICTKLKLPIVHTSRLLVT